MGAALRGCRDSGRRELLGCQLGGRDRLDLDCYAAHGVAHGRQAGRLAVGDLDAEALLAGHHDLDHVEAVGAQVFEPGDVAELRSVDAEMKREDFPDLRTDVTHRNAPKLSPPQGPSFPYTPVGGSSGVIVIDAAHFALGCDAKDTGSLA